MVECAGLEIQCTFRGTVSSNLTLSAKTLRLQAILGLFSFLPTKEPTIIRSAIGQRVATKVRHGKATVTVTGREAVTFIVAVPLPSALPL